MKLAVEWKSELECLRFPVVHVSAFPKQTAYSKNHRKQAKSLFNMINFLTAREWFSPQATFKIGIEVKQSTFLGIALSLFLLFLNDKKELFGCGLNDYNQLGLEKNITRINNNLDHLRHVA